VIYTLYYQELPAADIVQKGQSDEAIEFNGQQLIASQIEIVLDNSDPTKYDDRYAGSLFYGIAWYNQPLIGYDEERAVYTFVGRIKDVQVDDSQKVVVVKGTNYLRDAADTVCVYSASGITVAEACREILEDPDLVNIAETYLNLGSFQRGIEWHTDKDMTVDITLTADSNKNCLAVISELCRMGHASIIPIDNILTFWYWEAYAGELGETVRDYHVLPKTYKHNFDDGNIYNSASIKYKSGASVATATDEDASSIANYGTRLFSVPDDSPGDTLADYPIIIDNAAGAAWCAETALDRWANLRKLFQLSITEDLYHVPLGGQIDLDFPPYSREPGRVLRKKPQRDRRYIALECEFLNLPVERYARDTTPPDPVEIVMAFSDSAGAVTLKFTASQETDHYGYYIYFTQSSGEWLSAVCAQGVSYLEVINPTLGDDGYLTYTLTGLSLNTMYYFKIESIDTSYNRSEESNVAACFVAGEDANLYMLTGGLLAGLTLDYTNGEEGTVPTEYLTYADIAGTFSGAITACYESHVMRSRAGFEAVTWTAGGDPGDVMYSYRTSDDRITWSAWSADADAVGNKSVALAGAKYVQIRFIFLSPSWGDSDYVKVNELQEAA